MNTLYKLSIIFVFIGISNLTLAQKLSDSAQIYLLTCSPGDELYATFGHSAIRVIDPKLNMDWVYNYGTFNFKTPNFYLKFIQGNLNYQLVASEYKYFFKEYTTDNRAVYQQHLNLNNQQIQQLFEFLEWNRSPENKYYQYDFFFDNCATRIRDIHDKFFGSMLIYDTTTRNTTFRQMLQYYLKDIPWERFGINLLLGLPSDKKINTHHAMFLPDYMDTIYQSSSIKLNDTIQPFVKSRVQTIFTREPIYKKVLLDYITPSFVFWAVLILFGFITFIEFWKKTYYRIPDFILTFILGFLGLFLLFMWFGTEHKAAENNLNILWAFPLHILFAFTILNKVRRNKFRLYFLLFSVLSTLLLVLWKINPQQYDYAVIPIIITYAIRSGLVYFYPEKRGYQIN